MDQRTDGRMDGRTDGRTDPYIEMRGRILKKPTLDGLKMRHQSIKRPFSKPDSMKLRMSRGSFKRGYMGNPFGKNLRNFWKWDEEMRSGAAGAANLIMPTFTPGNSTDSGQFMVVIEGLMSQRLEKLSDFSKDTGSFKRSVLGN